MQTSEFLRLNEDGASLAGGPLPLQQSFFNSQPLLTDGIEPYLLGMIQQQANEVDTEEIDALRNFLFGPPGAGGMDLASINIQRGRDLGLPDYNQARIDFGLRPGHQLRRDHVRSDALAAAWRPFTARSTRSIIWVGGLAEDHVSGGTVGNSSPRSSPISFAARVMGTASGSRTVSSRKANWMRFEPRPCLIWCCATRRSRPARQRALQWHVAGGPSPAGSAASETPTELRRIDGVGNNPTDPGLGRAGRPVAAEFHRQL